MHDVKDSVLPRREQYLRGEVSFEEFYRSVYQMAGVTLNGHPIVSEVARALAAGDEHLNSIPIHRWDSLAAAAQGSLSRSLRRHGDFWSQAGGVCCMKQAARDAALAVK